MEAIPEWYIKPPENPIYLYSTASATSRDLMATNKAETARSGLAALAYVTNVIDGMTIKVLPYELLAVDKAMNIESVVTF